MSLDAHVGHACQHLLIEEPVTVSQDRMLLSTKGPIASVDSVFILANDKDYIPSSGLYSAARLSSSKPGPYQIRKCSAKLPVTGPDGDLLIIQTSIGFASFRLPVGDQVSIEEILRVIRLNTNTVTAESDQGCLVLSDNSTLGPDSFVRVSGPGAAALGFEQLGARGAEIYPPWVLDHKYDVLPTELPVGVNPVPARRPKFIRPLQGNPTLKVTYASMPDRCPRCGGTYVENDYRFDPQGEFVLIQDEDLLYQMCLKAILTILGSNPYHLNYGSQVTTRIGAKAISATATLIRSDIQDSLTRVQSQQRTQARYQKVGPKEALYAIGDVQVLADPLDPTVFKASVVVRNASNQAISLNIVFTVPGVVALKGTNGLSLGIQPAVAIRS
jgi:hypothetical protein